MTSFFSTLLSTPAPPAEPPSLLSEWRSFSSSSPAASRLATTHHAPDASSAAEAGEYNTADAASSSTNPAAALANKMFASLSSFAASAQAVTAHDVRAAASERARLVGARLESGATAVGGGLKGAAAAARDAGGEAMVSLQALNPDRLLAFFLLLAAAAFLLALALLVGLPLAPLAPSKFALPFTLGSCCNLAALAALRGPTAQLNHMIAPGRAGLSAAYGASVVATLYASLFLHSYLLTVITCGAQLVAMISFTLSHFPGGAWMAAS